MNVGLCAIGVVIYLVGCACLGMATEEMNPWTYGSLGFLFFGGMFIGVALP